MYHYIFIKLIYILKLQAGGQDNLSNIFLVNEMQKSMHADAYRDAQPLYQMDFRKAKDIRLLNPDLVYRKG